jgi:hypothetical protein
MTGSGAEPPNANLAACRNTLSLPPIADVCAARRCVVKLSLADGPSQNYCPRHAPKAESSTVRIVVMVDPDRTNADSFCCAIHIIYFCDRYTTLLCKICNADGAETAVSRPRSAMFELPLVMTKTGVFYFMILPCMSWLIEW